MERLIQLEDENINLKKTLILQKRKFFLLSSALEETIKNLEATHSQFKESESGQLFIENTQLHKTVKALSEEIEHLTEINQKMMQDLQSREFYEKYK
jgi:hypothetical protein